MTESSIVRENLMTQRGYVPYCGDDKCRLGMPRVKWDKNKEQFVCSCGWVSEFPKGFIERYKKEWGIGGEVAEQKEGEVIVTTLFLYRALALVQELLNNHENGLEPMKAEQYHDALVLRKQICDYIMKSKC